MTTAQAIVVGGGILMCLAAVILAIREIVFELRCRRAERRLRKKIAEYEAPDGRDRLGIR
jgi:hypothetical protein